VTEKKKSPRSIHTSSDALAHPLRVEILGVLREREASPRTLATMLKKSSSVVSYHAGVLLSSGCIALTRTRTHGGALESFYRAEP
jgi:DNA-binding transcriptional ArsR family regulator